MNGDKSTFTIGLKECEDFIKLTLDGRSFLIEGRFWGTPSDGREVYRFLRERYILPIYKLDTQE